MSLEIQPGPEPTPIAWSLGWVEPPTAARSAWRISSAFVTAGDRRAPRECEVELGLEIDAGLLHPDVGCHPRRSLSSSRPPRGERPGRLVDVLDTEITRPTGARAFTARRRVRLSDMDAAGRLRLDAVARFLQDAAIDDVQETGWGAPDHLWVVPQDPGRRRLAAPARPRGRDHDVVQRRGGDRGRAALVGRGRRRGPGRDRQRLDPPRPRPAARSASATSGRTRCLRAGARARRSSCCRTRRTRPSACRGRSARPTSTRTATSTTPSTGRPSRTGLPATARASPSRSAPSSTTAIRSTSATTSSSPRFDGGDGRRCLAFVVGDRVRAVASLSSP